jgi:hypothetical protein
MNFQLGATIPITAGAAVEFEIKNGNWHILNWNIFNLVLNYLQHLLNVSVTRAGFFV